ncbi:hypothetical protein BGX38DRAFT_165325 [Terfezia claveryi]|nr:hypothetical protein BGX38DRAFT_165325 [Terfezia claveryi]
MLQSLLTAVKQCFLSFFLYLFQYFSEAVSFPGSIGVPINLLFLHKDSRSPRVSSSSASDSASGRLSRKGSLYLGKVGVLILFLQAIFH